MTYNKNLDMTKVDEMAGVDMVNYPPHYTRKNAMECIDEMLLLFGKEEVMSFCKLNAWKYRYRAMDKNGQEDINKSDYYIKKYKELTDEMEKKFSDIKREIHI